MNSVADILRELANVLDSNGGDTVPVMRSLNELKGRKPAPRGKGPKRDEISIKIKSIVREVMYGY